MISLAYSLPLSIGIMLLFKCGDELLDDVEAGDDSNELSLFELVISVESKYMNWPESEPPRILFKKLFFSMC